MLFKDFFYFWLWRPFCSAGVEPFGQFGIWPYEEHLGENILNSSL